MPINTEALHSDRPGDIARAAALLKEGKLVAIPTETVYGLAANGLSVDAVEGIFAAKRRPADNPLILHVASIEAAIPLWAQQRNSWKSRQHCQRHSGRAR